jgi:hypothetical protein
MEPRQALARAISALIGDDARQFAVKLSNFSDSQALLFRSLSLKELAPDCSGAVALEGHI